MKHGTDPAAAAAAVSFTFVTDITPNHYKNTRIDYCAVPIQIAVSNRVSACTCTHVAAKCNNCCLTMIELWTSSSHTTASPRCGRHDISPKFASYPELKSSAVWRRWNRAIHLSSSSAYVEFPDSSLDPPEPTSGKLLLLLLFGCCKPSLSLAFERVAQNPPRGCPGPCFEPARRSAVSCAGL